MKHYLVPTTTVTGDRQPKKVLYTSTHAAWEHTERALACNQQASMPTLFV